MQDRELYQRIAAGVSPWNVGEIQMDPTAQWLEVQVECDTTLPQRCPHCECMLLACDYGEEQTWRQPDIDTWQILLKGRPPLVECPEHGVVSVSPPWADWYVRGLDKSLLGPWSLQQLKLLLETERISPSTLLKRGCSDKWVIAGTIGALFVRQDETVEPPLSVYELAAVDWAIAHAPAISTPAEPPASDHIAPRGNTWASNTSANNPPVDNPGHYFADETTSDSQSPPRPNHQSSPPPAPGARPMGRAASPRMPELNFVLRLLEDSEGETVRESRPRPSASRPPASPKPEKKRPTKTVEPSPSEWSLSLGRAVEMEQKAQVVPKQPEDNTADEPVKAAPRGKALVRRQGFQRGFQLFTIVYLINACLVCCLIPAVFMIFFSRLLLLSTSVFIPFGGGNDLQEGQLVECGLSALSLLVLLGFPVWHLFSNDGILWHYIPSAIVGMIVGFGLSPDYLDEVCAVLQWCQFCFGIATVGITIYTLMAVPAQSRMSLPMIAAGLLTALSAISLSFVRTGSMLSVQADAVPPQLRGVLPDASLYVFGLAGTLILIPAAILFELYRHTDFSTRQFIIRTSVIAGMYVVAGIATLEAFIKGAGCGFFDVPLALVPLASINALAAAIPSALMLVDPQYTLSDD